MWYDRDSGIVRVTVALLYGGLLEKLQIIMQIVVIDSVFVLCRASVFASW
jgi:hypothetical protein